MNLIGLALLAGLTIVLAAPAHALHLCARADTRGPDPTAPRDNSAIKLRTSCKPGREVSIGTTQQLAAIEGKADKAVVTNLGLAVAANSATISVHSVKLGKKAELPCITQVGSDVLVDGCNLHVRSGEGATWGGGTVDNDGTVNGLGNLIVGYNEGASPKTGSHNLIVGPNHSYTSHSGFIVGRSNVISGVYSSVSGGFSNTASGRYSSVAGGWLNTSSGDRSASLGGTHNLAEGENATVSGGEDNTASGYASAVSGGNDNLAEGENASVSGGDGNTASGYASAVTGGGENVASGNLSAVSGGSGNTASGTLSSVLGGTQNIASGGEATVSGGFQNQASGVASGVLTGWDNDAQGQGSAVVGGMHNIAGANFSVLP